MRRVLGSVAIACGLLALTATPSVAAASHCRKSDYAMQCVKVPNATPAAPTALSASKPPLAFATQASVYKYGIDFGWQSVSARTAWYMGARFAASYLSWDPTKNWTHSQLRIFHAWGLQTVFVWETTATRALSGYSGGQADARAAISQVHALGMPTSLPVYFAVDFDETPGQASTVASYFRGVNSVLGVWRTGGYGGYWVVSRLFNAGVIRYGWQTSAWSGGLWDPRAQLQQYAYYSTYDWDRAMKSSYGGAY